MAAGHPTSRPGVSLDTATGELETAALALVRQVSTSLRPRYTGCPGDQEHLQAIQAVLEGVEAVRTARLREQGLLP